MTAAKERLPCPMCSNIHKPSTWYVDLPRHLRNGHYSTIENETERHHRILATVAEASKNAKLYIAAINRVASKHAAADAALPRVTVGKIKDAMLLGERKPSPGRPRTIFTKHRLPKGRRKGVKLTCVPTAAYNAALTIGVRLDLLELADAKAEECRLDGNNSSGTWEGLFCNALNEVQDRVVFTSVWGTGDERWCGDKITLRQAADMMRDAGFESALVCTRTPFHGFAMHLKGRTVQIVDNGGFKSWEGWQGRNIETVFGCRRAADPIPPTPARHEAIASEPAAVRNLAIVRGRLAGDTIPALSARFTVGKQRISDIYNAVRRIASGEEYGTFAKTAGVTPDMAASIIAAVGGRDAFAK